MKNLSQKGAVTVRMTTKMTTPRARIYFSPMKIMRRNATSELLGALTEKERQQGCGLLKKVTGFVATILKSDQKWAALEEACVHHNEKPLKPIKVIKTRWNSHCNAFECHLSIIGGATRICTATKYEHLGLEKLTLSGRELKRSKCYLQYVKGESDFFALLFVILFTHDEFTTCACTVHIYVDF